MGTGGDLGGREGMHWKLDFHSNRSHTLLYPWWWIAPSASGGLLNQLSLMTTYAPFCSTEASALTPCPNVERARGSLRVVLLYPSSIKWALKYRVVILHLTTYTVGCAAKQLKFFAFRSKVQQWMPLGSGSEKHTLPHPSHYLHGLGSRRAIWSMRESGRGGTVGEKLPRCKACWSGKGRYESSPILKLSLCPELAARHVAPTCDMASKKHSHSSHFASCSHSQPEEGFGRF